MVHIDKEAVSNLSIDEVIDRWLMIHKGHVLVQRYKDGDAARLKPFLDGSSEGDTIQCMPFQELDYLELVDWSGRQVRDDKRGHVAKDAPTLLENLCITEKQWMDQINQYNRRYYRVVGTWGEAMELADRLGQQWFKTPHMA